MAVPYKAPAISSSNRNCPWTTPLKPNKEHTPVPVRNMRFCKCKALGICKPVLAIDNMVKICSCAFVETYNRTSVLSLPSDESRYRHNHR